MSDGGRHALESKVAAYVYHDNDPNVPRPTGTFGSVVWVGDVEPTNWQDGDIWESVGEAISTQHSHAGGPPIVVKSDLETFTDITTQTIVGGPTVNIPTGYALVQAVIHWNISADTTTDAPNMQIFLTLSGENTGTTITTERAWVRAAVARQGTGVRGAHVLTFLPGELEPGMTDFEATFFPSSVTWSGTSRVTIMVWPGSDIHEANQVGVTGLREIITYTENGAFVKANYPWLRAVRVMVLGGGGGGGGAQTTDTGESSFGQGGAAGGIAEKLIPVNELLASESVTVGAGGGSTSGTAGSPGGDSHFGSHCTGEGGAQGGIRAASTTIRVISSTTTNFGGNGIGGQINRAGDSGDDGVSVAHTATQVRGGRGGSSPYGGSSPARAGGLDPVPGSGYGAGGTGAANHASQTARAGADGRPGLVIVELYA